MGVLDWIRDRNRPKSPGDPDLDPKTHGHKTWKGVFAEIHKDEALAKRRNESGREPDGRNQKEKPGRSPSTVPRQPPSWER